MCSKTLKRNVGDRWLRNTFPGGKGVTVYLGIDHSERDRFYGHPNWRPKRTVTKFNPDGSFVVTEEKGVGKAGIRRRFLPYAAEAPLCHPPYLSKCEMLKECERDGLDPPRIYDEGFPHNNCKGFCTKAGHAQFLHLLKNRPTVFMENATEEDAFRRRTGKDVAVMKDRRGGASKPLPMLEFKRQVESGELKVNPRDWGKGCQCFTPDDDTEDGEE